MIFELFFYILGYWSCWIAWANKYNDCLDDYEISV